VRPWGLTTREKECLHCTRWTLRNFGNVPGLLSTTSPTTWRIFVTGEFQPSLLENIYDRVFPTQTAEEYFWVPTHAEYMWQVTSNPLCWRIFVTGEFQPTLLGNIYDRCDQNQTAGIVTKSGSVDYSPGGLIKMLLSQARCTKFWYTWVTQRRSSSRVKLRLCLCSTPTSCSGFKRLSPCETAVCHLNRLMNVEYFWDVFNRGIPKYSEKLLSRINLVHHKSHSITGLTWALWCTC
jgi:hypothetical protein